MHKIEKIEILCGGQWSQTNPLFCPPHMFSVFPYTTVTLKYSPLQPEHQPQFEYDKILLSTLKLKLIPRYTIEQEDTKTRLYLIGGRQWLPSTTPRGRHSEVTDGRTGLSSTITSFTPSPSLSYTNTLTSHIGEKQKT